MVAMEIYSIIISGKGNAVTSSSKRMRHTSIQSDYLIIATSCVSRNIEPQKACGRTKRAYYVGLKLKRLMQTFFVLMYDYCILAQITHTVLC